jgi:hypothetical protein
MHLQDVPTTIKCQRDKAEKDTVASRNPLESVSPLATGEPRLKHKMAVSTEFKQNMSAVSGNCGHVTRLKPLQVH